MMLVMSVFHARWSAASVGNDDDEVERGVTVVLTRPSSSDGFVFFFLNLHHPSSPLLKDLLLVLSFLLVRGIIGGFQIIPLGVVNGAGTLGGHYAPTRFFFFEL